jgi:hypothetical protein
MNLHVGERTSWILRNKWVQRAVAVGERVIVLERLGPMWFVDSESGDLKKAVPDYVIIKLVVLVISYFSIISIARMWSQWQSSGLRSQCWNQWLSSKGQKGYGWTLEPCWAKHGRVPCSW